MGHHHPTTKTAKEQWGDPKRAFKSFKNNFKKTLENDNTLVCIMFNDTGNSNWKKKIMEAIYQSNLVRNHGGHNKPKA